MNIFTNVAKFVETGRLADIMESNLAKDAKDFSSDRYEKSWIIRVGGIQIAQLQSYRETDAKRADFTNASRWEWEQTQFRMKEVP